MLRQAIVPIMLVALANGLTNAVCADDDATSETDTMDQADVLRELTELRRLATDLQNRINSLESKVAGSQCDLAPMPPVALDGCCPVELVENDRWVRGTAKVSVVHRGRTYLFKDAEARSAQPGCGWIAVGSPS